MCLSCWSDTDLACGTCQNQIVLHYSPHYKTIKCPGCLFRITAMFLLMQMKLFIFLIFLLKFCAAIFLSICTLRSSQFVKHTDVGFAFNSICFAWNDFSATSHELGLPFQTWRIIHIVWLCQFIRLFMIEWLRHDFVYMFFLNKNFLGLSQFIFQRTTWQIVQIDNGQVMVYKGQESS